MAIGQLAQAEGKHQQGDPADSQPERADGGGAGPGRGKGLGGAGGAPEDRCGEDGGQSKVQRGCLLWTLYLGLTAMFMRVEPVVGSRRG